MKNSWLSVLRLIAITASMGFSALYGGYDNKWQSHNYHYSGSAFSYARYTDWNFNYGNEYQAYDNYPVAYKKGSYPQYRAYSYPRKSYVDEAYVGFTSI